jgi:hypothetical protein
MTLKKAQDLCMYHDTSLKNFTLHKHKPTLSCFKIIQFIFDNCRLA